jgi:uncharacterized DUF497 family protein
MPFAFEFDSEKSTANKAKHGIDFIEAQRIWSDAERLETPTRSLDELRHQVIGRIGEMTGLLSLLIAMTKSASSRSAVRVQTKKRGTSQTQAVSAARLDEMHDAGEDLSAHLDLPKATRPGREVQRVNVDFPVDLLHAIDREARRIGVSRQAFIKLRLADTLANSR